MKTNRFPELLPYECADGVFAVDYEKLYKSGIRGIIFDVDNTLVHHGDGSNSEVDEFFVRLHEIGFKTVLLSDNTDERVRRFVKNIDTPYICDADKPNPKGYKRALEIMGLERDKAVVIGDQMFVDIVGANRSGIPSILVKFIRLPDERKIGKKRYIELLVTAIYKRTKYAHRLGDILKPKRRKLFCEISPLCYEISIKKEIVKRHIQNLTTKETFAKKHCRKSLPILVSECSSKLIKKGKGIDPVLQQNKAVNIRLAIRRMDKLVIHPGETFSFWDMVGKTTKRRGFKAGRIISGGKLIPGVGGGLCNLANTINRMVLTSPLDVTEFHTHSDALAPDEGERVPLSSGTSVSYNYVDYRFKNNTNQNFQLLLWCDDERLYGELRTSKRLPYRYFICEEGHHFVKENGKYYRVSKIYRCTADKATNKIIDKELIWDNHSKVMYDYDLIPAELITR